ncbi:MAG: hypothetical protein ACRD6X_21930, partial [Pyrinomonadaceae bacterium]
MGLAKTVSNYQPKERIAFDVHIAQGRGLKAQVGWLREAAETVEFSNFGPFRLSVTPPQLSTGWVAGLSFSKGPLFTPFPPFL